MKIRKYIFLSIFCSTVLLLLLGKALAEDNIYSNPDVAKGIKQYAEIYMGNEAGDLIDKAGSSGGMGSFSIAKLVAWFIFGAIGFIAFSYGRKMSSWRPLVLGLVLMIYPYFVNNTILLYVVGSALCTAAYIWRE